MITCMKGHTVVAVPGVENRFQLAVWDGAGLVERGLGVVRLTCCMGIQWLEVHCASWFASLLCTDHHSLAPCDRVPIGTSSITSRPGRARP